jgi:Xaa-Pro aminopeptidase
MLSGRDERLKRIQAALIENRLSAVICSHNLNVLLLTGYWPVTGTSVAIATDEPRIMLLVPEDEEQLATSGWADQIHTFQPASLNFLKDSCSGLLATLQKVLPPLVSTHSRLGYESGVAHLPASYVSQQIYGDSLPKLLQDTVNVAELVPADLLLKGLRMRPTAWERNRIRAACADAAQAYLAGSLTLQPGTPESEVAVSFQQALCVAGNRRHDMSRIDGCFYCMSGPNAFRAYAAFQQSQRKTLQIGEPILIHCNSYADGYWTDLTRTYVLGVPDERLNHMQDAILTARSAALNAIQPGALASNVDRAARTALADAGYGEAFRHATGHGVGFSPIDHDEWPRIHPCSPEILEEGMVFNIEPGIYIAGFGGLRDCNMVTVTANGYEVLSPFHLTKQDWSISV